MDIDETTIRDLIEVEDEHGVLSVYVGYTPTQAADPQPTTPIEVRNQIKQLKAELADRDADLARAVESRLEAIDGELAAVLDPKAPGRGRALFVGVDSGETRTVSVQIPFRDRVLHHDRAYVRPLVAAVDEGRAAGILVVWREGARLLAWNLGVVEELGTWDFELGDAQLADVKSGPSPGRPQNQGRGHVDHESFRDRIEENHHRFLRDVVDDVVERAKAAAWDRLVVAGTPKIRELARDLLPTDDGLRVLMADTSLEDAAPHVVAEHVWPLLRSVHHDRARTLVTQATERALAGGAGALGLRQVCDALNEGRVAHLLYDDALDLEGYRSEEDTLHPRPEGPVAQSDVPLHREPRFVEAMVQKAIGTSAAVTPVDAEVTDGLADHEGVAALLRW